MGTKFHRDGVDWTPMNDKTLDLHEKLPARNYLVKLHPMRGFYLEEVGDFVLPKKLYGPVEHRVTRILNTFNERIKEGRGTGVLLSGEKGSGKTLLAKVLSVRATNIGMPTILINEPYRGDAFNQLIQAIEQPAILLFDEFEKVYGRRKWGDEQDDDEGGKPDPSQSDLLTLMDGVFPTPKMFVLTCNNTSEVDSRMLNRPGRLFYSLEYRGLTREMIMEYGNDALNNKEHVSDLVAMSAMFRDLSFDMVQAVCEEANRYKERPSQAIEMLNVRPLSDVTGTYEVSGVKCNAKGETTRLWFHSDNYDYSEDQALPSGTQRLSPLKPFNLHYVTSKAAYEKVLKRDGESWLKMTVTPAQHLVDQDVMQGTYTYKVGDFEIKLKEEFEKMPTAFEKWRAF